MVASLSLRIDGGELDAVEATRRWLVPLGVGPRRVLQDAVHVVLRLVQEPAVRVPVLALDRHDRALAVVHEDHRHADAALAGDRHCWVASMA